MNGTWLYGLALDTDQEYIYFHEYENHVVNILRAPVADLCFVSCF